MAILIHSFNSGVILMAIFVFSTINTTRNFAVLIKNPKFVVLLGGLMARAWLGPSWGYWGDGLMNQWTDGRNFSRFYRTLSSYRGRCPKRVNFLPVVHIKGDTCMVLRKRNYQIDTMECVWLHDGAFFHRKNQ